MAINKHTKTLAVKESRLRSLVKSLIYRVVSIIGTGILTWTITRDVGKAISITLVVQAFLIILYYAYERIWNKINWGRKTEAI